MKMFWISSLWLLLFGLSSSLSFGQASLQLRMVVPEQNSSADSSWLPRRYQESLGPYLEKIVTHAESRRLCPKLLEARLAIDSPVDNPKFIVTCKLDNLQSVNMVYTKQDVIENFRNITYEHKDVVIRDPAQLLFDTLAPSRIDQAKAACKETVRSQARDGHLAVLPDDDDINIRPRQDNKLAVFVEYHTGKLASVLNYTATCVVDEDNLVAMEVYPF